MCGDNHAANQAEQRAIHEEKLKQEQISNTEKALSDVYDSPERQAQYDDYVAALRDSYGTDLNKQKSSADRNLKFSMARSGLTGGSAAVDSNRTLGEEFQKGVLNAENKAQASLGELKAADEATRSNLFQLGLQGADATTTASRAQAGAQSALASQQATAQAQGLGDIFAGTADIYKRQNEAAAKRAQLTAPVGSLYGANS